MQAPDPIETILARLMPPALSQEFQSGLDETIDTLAGTPPENVVEISSGKWLVRSLIGGGIAAAMGAMFAIFPSGTTSGPAVAKVEDSPPGLVLMSASDRLESVTDEGMRQDSEGTAMHAVKFKAVQENNVRDEESGLVVRISEPREEILMMPIGVSNPEAELKKPISTGMVEAAALPVENNGPLRVVNVAEKSASFTFQDEGKAVVTREGGRNTLVIHLIQYSIKQKDDFMPSVENKKAGHWENPMPAVCRSFTRAAGRRGTSIEKTDFSRSRQAAESHFRVLLVGAG